MFNLKKEVVELKILITNFKKDYSLLYSKLYNFYIVFERTLKEKEKEILAKRKAFCDRVNKQNPLFIKEVKVSMIMGFFLYVSYFFLRGIYDCGYISNDPDLIYFLNFHNLDPEDWPEWINRVEPVITWEVPSTPIIKKWYPWIHTTLENIHTCPIDVIPAGAGNLYYSGINP